MEIKEQLQAPKNEQIKISTSGSVAVIDALLSEKVDTIFGYPGGAIMPIYDALFDFVCIQLHYPKLNGYKRMLHILPATEI